MWLTTDELIDLIVDAAAYAAVSAVDVLAELPRDATAHERRAAVMGRRDAIRAKVAEQRAEVADEHEPPRELSRAERHDERARRRWGVA